LQFFRQQPLPDKVDQNAAASRVTWRQSYDFDLQRQRCKKLKTQLMAKSVFRVKIIFR
jgi:hypothetical protein